MTHGAGEAEQARGARVALITGAGSGIGRASAHRLAADGFALALTDVDGDAVARVAAELPDGTPVITEVLDVTDPQACERVTARTADRFSALDAVVHSAGVNHRVAPTWELTLDEWHRTIDVNLTGTFNVLHAVVPPMVQQGRGHIVTLASMAGKDGNANNAAYSAAKGGVIALVKAIGRELALTGVVVNTIAPAMIDTAILAGVDPGQLATFAGRIPMGRIGGAHEVAALISWLVSPDCSFSTGAVYDISGGRATY